MKQELLTPKINPNDESLEIVHWYVKSGDSVAEGESVADLSTSKATVTVNAPCNGFIEIHYAMGEKAQVGSPLASFHEKKEMVKSPAAKPDTGMTAGFSSVQFSKAAKKLVEEKGLSESVFAGMGLVTTELVEMFLAGTLPTRSERVVGPKAREIEQLSRGREGRLSSSITVQFPAEKLYHSLREKNLFNGSPLPLVLSETAKALRNFPRLLSYYENGSVHFYDAVHLGVAMDTGKGLKVATLRNADTLAPADFFEKLTDFALRDLRGALTSEELTGSTFTVTDLSSGNVLYFQPLINGRQAAILGVGGDKSLPGSPITLTVVFDHRVSNGKEVADFLNTVKKKLQGY